jgi:hypothetical protein
MRLVKGPLLYVLIRALKPKIVLETGVASGVSTLFMLQALNHNTHGTLYSIDLPNVVEASEIPVGKPWMDNSELFKETLGALFRRL